MKKLLPILLAFAMALSLVCGLAVVGCAEEKAVVLDLSSAAHMQTTHVEYLGTAADSGKCTLDAAKNAWKVEKATDNWKGPYRYIMRATQKDMFGSNYRYIRVVYMVEKAGNFELYIRHNAKQDKSELLAKSNGQEAGKWYASEPVRVNDDLLQRMNDAGYFTLGFVTEDNDSVFYLKQLVAFESEAAAYAYFGDKNGGPVTVKEADASAVSTPEPAETKPAQTESSGPVIMDFSSKSKMLKTKVERFIYSPDPKESGYCEYDGDMDAWKVEYVQPEWKGTHRFMPRFTEKNMIPEGYSYIRVKYMAETSAYYSVEIHNNGDPQDTVQLCTGAGRQAGEWYVSEPMRVPSNLLARINTGSHFTVGFDCDEKDSVFYLKEIAFFKTPEEGYAYYGDNPAAGTGIQMTFSHPTNALIRVDTNYPQFTDKSGKTYYDTGYSLYNEEEDAWELQYSPTGDENGNPTDYFRGNYRMMPYFNQDLKAKMSKDASWVRIQYKANHGKDEESGVRLFWANNGNWQNDFFVLDEDVQDTGDGYVWTKALQLSQSAMERMIDKNSWMTLAFDASKPDGQYFVKNIMFFTSKEDADAFDGNTGISADILLGGKDVSVYQIVIGDEACREDAVLVRDQIRAVTGYRLPIVTDTEKEQEYEILIGNTNRAESQIYYAPVTGKFITGELPINEYTIAMDGSKLVFAAGTYWSLRDVVKEFLVAYMGLGWTELPETLSISADYELTGLYADLIFDPWPIIEETVLEEPIVFTDTFDGKEENPAYWMESVSGDLWKVKNGTYNVNADKFTISWLHVFERDVDYSVRFRAENLAEDAKFGVYTRYTYPTSYVAVGYDNARGAWYIEQREGNIFMPLVLDLAEAELKEGAWYTLRVELLAKKINVYVNDKLVMTSDVVQQDTSGRVGLFAQSANLAFDDVDLTLVSGQGRIQDGVIDQELGYTEDGTPLEETRGVCGASYLELEDGKLLFLYPGFQFVSEDKGITWEPTTFVNFSNIPSIIRLQSGALLWMHQTTKDGKNVHIARWSGDDGKTWEDRGVISEVNYKGYGTVKGINMNEKLMQMDDGRIFASQNFDGVMPSSDPNSHCRVFVELYYSDDEGKTWTRSETVSYDITDITHFGESQVLQGKDGKLIWLTGWNNTNYILYSISEDNGVTWSKAKESHVKMSNSSVVTCRDPYADELTYYMLFVYNEIDSATGRSTDRSRLALARSYDGITWEYLMDVDRWESTMAYQANSIAMYVNPGIYVTEDYVYVATGHSAEPAANGDQHQRQINLSRRIEKDKLVAYDVWPNTIPPVTK